MYAKQIEFYLIFNDFSILSFRTFCTLLPEINETFFGLFNFLRKFPKSWMFFSPISISRGNSMVCDGMRSWFFLIIYDLKGSKSYLKG